MSDDGRKQPERKPVNLNEIPAAACCLAGGEVTIGDNGEKAKTAPVEIRARTGKPIEHWFWGRVVHDLAGMRVHKARLPLDYAHNDAEILGYLNHFDTAGGNLKASGALTPFTETDRASEVLFKMRQGVPYEASIFFGGDGIKIEEVAEGKKTTVNGFEFEGPGIVVREWPLRGVAVCPYGADQNTETIALSTQEKFSATPWRPESKGETKMETPKTEAVEAKAEPEAQPAVEQPAVEAKAEAPAAKLSPTSGDTRAPEPSLGPSAPAATAGASAAPEAPTSAAIAVAAETKGAAESPAPKPEQILAEALGRIATLEADIAAKQAENVRLAGEVSGKVAELDAVKKALSESQSREAELSKKLAALTAGAPAVSSNVAEVKNQAAADPWKKAQKKK